MAKQKEANKREQKLRIKISQIYFWREVSLRSDILIVIEVNK